MAAKNLTPVCPNCGVAGKMSDIDTIIVLAGVLEISGETGLPTEFGDSGGPLWDSQKAANPRNPTFRCHACDEDCARLTMLKATINADRGDRP